MSLGSTSGEQNHSEFAPVPGQGAQPEMQHETHSRPDMDERPQWSPPRETPVADAGYASRVEPAATYAAPAPQPEAEPAAPARRRSTVREPAPTFSSPVVTPMPAPQPMPSAAPAPEPAPVEDAGKPRRTGWWAKRLLGGDKG
jgi:ribonuclease E